MSNYIASVYDKYDLVPVATKYGGSPAYGASPAREGYPPDFSNLFAASLLEDVAPLDEASIMAHPLGLMTVGTYWSARGNRHSHVLSHAAVTGFEEYECSKLAVIGGVLTLPEARGEGHAFRTLKSLLQHMSIGRVKAEHEHLGFMAVCNAPALELFTTKLGFLAVGSTDQKHTVVRYH